jgi:G3E family GTPase
MTAMRSAERGTNPGPGGWGLVGHPTTHDASHAHTHTHTHTDAHTAYMTHTHEGHENERMWLYAHQRLNALLKNGQVKRQKSVVRSQRGPTNNQRQRQRQTPERPPNQRNAARARGGRARATSQIRDE